MNQRFSDETVKLDLIGGKVSDAILGTISLKFVKVKLLLRRVYLTEHFEHKAFVK